MSFTGNVYAATYNNGSIHLTLSRKAAMVINSGTIEYVLINEFSYVAMVLLKDNIANPHNLIAIYIRVRI